MRKFVHYSPLFNYIKNGETAKITSYLSSATISEINYHAGKSLKTPLHFAVIYQNIESIILLLHHGADPNAEDKYGKNPVYYVVKSKFLDAVVAFRKYQKGRTPTSEDIDMYWNFFPVNWSLLQFQLEKFLKFLIDVDINLNLKNSSGYDGLFLCLVSSPRIRYKMGAVFLRLVGDLKITWRDNNGHNVLHVSAIRGYHLATQLLIRYKPILATLPDHDGKSPFGDVRNEEVPPIG
ncbi:hypothetical protein HK098_006771 [Nowakowskiella sp. JEL0407]|nr:hypothetical protein HK098_006771 [Nowakowskiella sp. JEL0407]